jgi:transposase InsO family protein
MSETMQVEMVSDALLMALLRRGECRDNAAMESFFSSLKTESLSVASMRPNHFPEYTPTHR